MRGCEKPNPKKQRNPKFADPMNSRECGDMYVVQYDSHYIVAIE